MTANETLAEVNSELKRDVLAADFRISLFAGIYITMVILLIHSSDGLWLYIGAVQSFKYESLLKPVPASFKNECGEVDIDCLRNLVSQLPRLPFEFEKVDYPVLDLLKVILLNSSHRLTSVSLGQFTEVLSGSLILSTVPHWIFRIDHGAVRNDMWERRKGNSKSFYAFHGSRFENFHSILNLGLHQHLNKVSVS